MSFQELLKEGHKYNAVIAVVVTIFVVAILYMIWLDLKIRKLERNETEEFE